MAGFLGIDPGYEGCGHGIRLTLSEPQLVSIPQAPWISQRPAAMASLLTLASSQAELKGYQALEHQKMALLWDSSLI